MNDVSVQFCQYQLLEANRVHRKSGRNCQEQNGPLDPLKMDNTYRRSDRIISRARINPNSSKATTHLRFVPLTRELRVRACNDDILRRRVSINQSVRRRDRRAAIALGSILESSEDIAQPETFAHAQLDGHRIARVTEDSRIQSFDASIIIVATLPVAAANDERCLECLRVRRHVRCCD